MANVHLSNEISDIRVSPATDVSRIFKGGPLITSHVDLYLNNINVVGPISPFMGISGNTKICRTCNQTDINHCCGHIGIIPHIATYVNPNLSETLAILTTLACHNCSRLVITDKRKKTFPPARTDTFPNLIDSIKDLRKYISLVSNESCAHCKAPIIIYKASDEPTISTIILNKKEYLTPYQLDSINKLLLCVEDWNEYFGRDTYRNLLSYIFIRNQLMLPTTDRNALQHPISNAPQTNYITFEYITLLHINSQLIDDAETNMERNELSVLFFQCLRNLLFNHKDIGNKYHYNKQMKPQALLDIGGKDGSYRRVYISKIRSSSGRDVALCNSRLEYNQSEITTFVAKKIHRVSHITDYNIHFFSAFERSNRDGYPRINTIIRDGVHYSPSMPVFSSMDLQEGDIIHRDLITGDIFSINRPPAMLPGNYSMSVLKVQDTCDSRFAGTAVNPTTMTNLYGGDMDGDTLIHFYDTTENVFGDMIELLGNNLRFRSIKNGATNLCSTNDGLIGHVIGTHQKTIIQQTAFDFMLDDMNILPDEKKIARKKFISSGQTTADLICLFLPDDFTIDVECGFHNNKFVFMQNPHPTRIVIENGHYVSGILTPNITNGNPFSSIADRLYTNYSIESTIKILHRMQRCAELALMHIGLTCDHEQMKADETITASIKHAENLYLLFSNIRAQILEVIPHYQSELGMWRSVSSAMVELSPSRYLEQIISTFPKGGDNMIILLIGSIKNKLDQFMKSVSTTGISFLRENMSNQPQIGRINVYSKIQSSNMNDFGLIRHSYKDGYTIRDIMFQSSESRNSLIERKIGAQGPGFISRCKKIVLSGVCTATGTFILDAPMSADPCIISSCFGVSGGRPELVQYVHTTDWVSLTPANLSDTFILPASLSEYNKPYVSELFAIYEKMYNLCVENYNNTSQIPHDLPYMQHNDILFNFWQYNFKSKIIIEPSSKSHDILGAFTLSLLYLPFGKDAMMDDFDLPAYRYNAISLLIVSLLSSISPRMAVYMDPNDLNKEFGKIHQKISETLLSPMTAIGTVVACALTEEMTQNALNAPSTNKGVYEELKRFERTFDSNLPLNGYDIVVCEVKTHNTNYTQYVHSVFSDLDPLMEIYTHIPVYMADFIILDPAPDYNLHVFCTISQQTIHTKGLTPESILLSLILHSSYYINYISQDIHTFKMLISMPPPADMGFMNIHAYVQNHLNSMYISGIVGIKWIEPFSATRQTIENGKIIEQEISIIKVNTNSLDSVLQIPGVSINALYFENPQMQERYFGKFAAMISMIHNGRLMFADQNAGHVHLVAQFSFKKPYFVPSNQWAINFNYKDRFLQNGAISSTRQRIMSAPFCSTNAPVSDPVSTMVTGGAMNYGSAAFPCYECF